MAGTAGKVDILIAGVGTGDTMTGIAKTLKIRTQNIKIITVETASCPVLSIDKKEFTKSKD